MNEKVKKGIVLFLAVLTALAFAPFVFQPPQTPQEQQQDIRENNNATSTATSSESSL